MRKFNFAFTLLILVVTFCCGQDKGVGKISLHGMSLEFEKKYFYKKYT